MESSQIYISEKVRNASNVVINPSTEETLLLIKAKTDNLDVALSTRTKSSDQQHTIVDSSTLPSGASTEAKQDNLITAINSTGANTTGLTSGRKVVTVTNTAVTLGTGACKEVTITALIGNTDVVVIGGSAVVFTLASRTGNAIYPGDSFTVSIDNISKIYINGTAGDGVSFNYTT